MLQMNLAHILINVMKPEKEILTESSCTIKFGMALSKRQSTFPDKYWLMFLQERDPVLFPLLTKKTFKNRQSHNFLVGI